MLTLHEIPSIVFSPISMTVYRRINTTVLPRLATTRYYVSTQLMQWNTGKEDPRCIAPNAAPPSLTARNSARIVAQVSHHERPRPHNDSRCKFRCPRPRSHPHRRNPPWQEAHRHTCRPFRHHPPHRNQRVPQRRRASPRAIWPPSAHRSALRLARPLSSP